MASPFLSLISGVLKSIDFQTLIFKAEFYKLIFYDKSPYDKSPYDKNLKTILIGNSKPIFPLLTSKTSQEDLSGGIP